MILTCPSCSTRYFADDGAIGAAGRNVRCAACGQVWFCEGHLVLDQAAPDDLLPKSAPQARAPLTREQVERMRRGAASLSANAAVRAQQAERDRKQRIRVAIGAWGAAGAVMAATAGAAIVYREDVAALWPNTATAFAAMGLDVNIYGLEFTELNLERTYEGPTPVLVVKGALRNLSGEVKNAPPLRFALRDAEGREIYSWVVRMDGRRVEAGGALPFVSSIDNPPIQAVDLEAAFATEKEAVAALSHVAPSPPTQPALVLPEGASDEPMVLGPAEEKSAHDQVGALIEPSLKRAGPLSDLAPRTQAESLAPG